MFKPLRFETLHDMEGSVTVGWAGDAVIYAHVEGGMSAELGARYAAHLQKLVTSASGVHYFADASALTRYDLLARSAFVRVALANRRRFLSFTFLIWPVAVSPAARTFASALGENVDLCQESRDFERRLTNLAPLARHRLDPANWGELEATERSAR